MAELRRTTSGRALALAATMMCALLAVIVPAPATASRFGQPAVGVYSGPGDTAGHDEFSAWLGQEASYALDYIDEAQSWTDIAERSDWVLARWSAWVHARPDRRLILSVPMLNHASSGMLAEGAAGAFDEHFRRLAQEITDHGLGNAIIRIGWEANGDWYPWRASVDPEAWKTYFRRIVTVMRSVQPKVEGVPRQSFQFDLSYCRGTSGTQVRFETIYPGDDVVDILGLDSYDTKWRDALSPPEVRWHDQLTQDMGLDDFEAFAAAHGKPMSLSEWGLWPAGRDDNGGIGDNPYFIDRTADWLSDNAADVRYHVLFNHLSGWSGDHRLASYASSQRRYRARFGTVPATLGGPESPETVPAPPETDEPIGGGVFGDATPADAGDATGLDFRGDGVSGGA